MGGCRLWDVRASTAESFGSGRCGWSLELRPDYASQWEAIRAVAGKLGIGAAETLRTWVRRAEVDAGKRPGVTTAESEQMKALKKEIAELRRANEILKAASIFFAAELDRPGRR